MGGVTSGIDNVKSKALQLGGVVAGAFGIKALTNDFASAKDELGKFAEVFGVNADDIQAFGNALRLEGGTLEGFMSQLAGVEKFRAGLAVGDIGFLSAAGIAGIDVTPLIEAENATDAFLELADQFQGLSQKQRINAAAAIGLDESTIRLLSKGRENIEQVADAQRKMRPITKEMTDAARDFNDEFQNLSTNIGGVADKISARLLPQINNVIGGMNGWFDINRDIINSGLDTFLDSIGNNAVAIGAALTAITVGTTAATAGGVISKAGGMAKSGGIAKFGSSVGKFGSAVGKFGLVAGSFAVGQAIGDVINENLSERTSDLIGGTLTQILADFGLESAQETIRKKERSERILNGSPIIPAGMPDNIVNIRPVISTDKIEKPAKTIPITIKNQTILDGRVIDERVIKTVGEMANQAVEDLTSTEGG